LCLYALQKLPDYRAFVSRGYQYGIFVQLFRINLRHFLEKTHQDIAELIRVKAEEQYEY
jgi:hypothetical protein